MGLVVALALVLLISYWSVRRPAGWKLLVGGLKLGGGLLIALCLLNPLWSRTRPRTGENIVAIALDASASMNVRGGRDSRGAELLAVARNQEAAWQTQLASQFDVRRFTCGDRLTAEDFHTVESFRVGRSRLLGNVDSLLDRFSTQPLAAVLVFTDGNATDAELLNELPAKVPVFPVLPTAPRDLVDLTVGEVAVSETPFEDAPITLRARIVSSGLPQAQVIASIAPLDADQNAMSNDSTELSVLEDSANETAGNGPGTDAAQGDVATPTLRHRETAEQTITLDDSGQAPLEFELNPASVGMLFFRLHVRLADEVANSEDQTREVTLQNNTRLLVVERRSQPTRILYVGGRPNWEYKFLNRAVADDPQLQLVSLVRIARKEARFDFRGRAGERGNSLFRGFKDEVDEELEAYDEPVLIRLNTQDEVELRDGFPKTAAGLFAYDALILDDVEGEFFRREQQVLIDRFVAERGGGLLMLGGIDSFRNGGWDKTSVRDALPLYLDRASEQPQGALQLRLTREGWLQPWVRLRSTEEAERSRLDTLPQFQTLSPLEHLKPAARILAEFVDESGRVFPGLVVQDYGSGQAAAMLLGDWWRAGLKADNAETLRDHGKAWRQWIRWLVSKTPQRIEVACDPLPEEPQARIVRVRLRDADYQPQENAAVRLDLHTPDGKVVPYDAEPSLSAPGLFEVTVMASEPGPYRVDVQAVAGEEEPETLTSVGGWVSDPLAEEFAVTTVNRELMQQLADRTGGRVLTVAELPRWVDSLETRELPRMQAETLPLWHSPWLLLLALGCLVAEWGLRRRRGLS